MISIRDLTGRSELDRHRHAGRRAPAQGVEGDEARGGVLPQGSGPVAEAARRRGIHRAGALELYSIDRTLIADLVTRLDRRMAFAVSISGRELFIA